MANSFLTTETIIESLRPVIYWDEEPAQPITVHLNVDQWNSLNQLWAELHGDLEREELSRQRQVAEVPF
jgi:hypothetical protein